MSLRLKSKATFISAATILATAALGAYVFHEENRPPILEIYIFALKGGQSVFIRTPQDKRILINGGGNPDVIREITKILPFYSRRIETVIATDDSANNVSGLVDVVDRYNVDRAYIPATTLESLDIASATDEVYTTFIQTLADKKITTAELKDGDVISFDSDINSQVFFPASSSEFTYSKASAPEIGLQIRFKSTAFTFIGDASKKVQKYIAASSSVSDLNDANHSGAASSSTSSDALSGSGVLIVSNGASPDNMSAELMDLLHPAYIVYSKSPTASKASKDSSAVEASSTSQPSKKAKTKKKPVDPLESIPMENRLNVKEKGTVHIISDGQNVTII